MFSKNKSIHLDDLRASFATKDSKDESKLDVSSSFPIDDNLDEVVKAKRVRRKSPAKKKNSKDLYRVNENVPRSGIKVVRYLKLGKDVRNSQSTVKSSEKFSEFKVDDTSGAAYTLSDHNGFVPWEPSFSLPATKRNSASIQTIRKRKKIREQQALYGKSNTVSKKSTFIKNSQYILQKSVFDNQEQQIRAQLEQNIVKVRRNLPLEFLRRYRHLGYAFDTALSRLNEIFTKYYIRRKRKALSEWKRWNIKRKMEDRAVQLILLTRISGLSRCLTIISDHHYKRMDHIFSRWRAKASKLRAMQRNFAALTIQCALRCYFSRRVVTYLRWQREFKLQFNSAIIIQCRFRYYSSRCIAHLLLIEKLRIDAANVIQRSVRSFNVRMLALRQKQRESALRMQRMWRGYRGRCLAICRKQAFKDVATILYENVVQIEALARGTKQISSVIQIERFYLRCWERFHLKSGLRSFMRRIRFFPAFRIQRSWKRFRMAEIQVCVDRWLVSPICLRLYYSSRTIQLAVRGYQHRKRVGASIHLQRIFRDFHSRNETIHLQLALASQLRLSIDKLPHHTRKYNEASFESYHMICARMESVEQAMRRRKYYEYFSLTELRVRNKSNSFFEQLMRDGIHFNAVVVQKNFRAYKARHFAAQFRHARYEILEAKLPRIYRKHSRRMLRIRVLKRWRVLRRRTMNSVFRPWKAFYFGLKRAREAKRIEALLKKARWHWERRMLQPVLHHLHAYVQYRGRKKAKRAIANKHFAHKMWHRWSINFRTTSIIDNIFWGMQRKIVSVAEWHRRLEKGRLNRRARMLFSRTLLSSCFRAIASNYEDTIVKYNRAVEYHTMNLPGRVFKALRLHVGLMSKVDTVCRKARKVRAVDWWKYHTKRAIYDKLQWTDTVEYYDARWQKSILEHWKRAKYIRETKERLILRGDTHWGNKNLARSINEWLSWGEMHQMLMKMIQRADAMRNKRLFRLGFGILFGLWAETAGARRIEASIRIQTCYRAKIARRSFAKLLLLNQYKVERRILSGTDVHEMTPQELFTCFKDVQWVLVLFYFPWELPPEPKRLEFNKAATTLRTSKSFKFVTFNASQKLENEELAYLNFQLEYLPAVHIFWQGRGRGTLEFTGRFYYCCGDYTGDIKCSSIIAWMEKLIPWSRHYTAVDIQANIRGYLTRSRLCRERDAHKNESCTRIQRWFFRRTREKRIRETNRAALKLQRWYRKRLFIIVFKRTVIIALQNIRRPAIIIQRSLRAYFCRMLMKRVVEEKRATPVIFANSPICLHCENDEDEKLKLGLIKCNECQEPYCDACFKEYHNKGGRAKHSIHSIDFRAFEENREMCQVCEVQNVRRVCEQCNEIYCVVCFEKAHPKRSMKKKEHSWTSPAVFRSLAAQTQREQTKAKGKASKSLSENLSIGPEGTLAQDIVHKNEWKTLKIILAHRAKLVEDEHAMAARQELLEETIEKNRDIVREAFELYDGDGNGWIDAAELKDMLHKELCEPVSEGELHDAMKVIDKDGNGKIEFEELLAWISEEMVNSTRSGTKSSLLRKKLQAKRKFRKFKHGVISRVTPSMKEIPIVPGYKDVHAITSNDYELKRVVFLRFMREEYDMSWIVSLGENHFFDEEKGNKIFKEIFMPKWNNGKLDHSYYYDQTVFDHNGVDFRQQWSAEKEIYEFIDVKSGSVSRVDPRLEERLREEAMNAFHHADQDLSSSIDLEEFKVLLKEGLCEPISTTQAKEIMAELDRDGSGTIEFEEFFEWYAADQSQKHRYSAKLAGLHRVLRAQRDSKRAFKQAAMKSKQVGKHLKRNMERAITLRQLEMDSRNASPELVVLLKEGYAKSLSMKALQLNANNVDKSREWLNDELSKMEEDKLVRDEENRKQREEMMRKLRAATESTTKTVAKAASSLKKKFVGEKKSHADNVSAVLMGLEKDLMMAEKLRDD